MKIFLWLIIAVIIFLVSIRYIERHSIYFPMKDVISDPTSVELAYEEVYFYTLDNKRLNGWYIANDKAKFTIIFCHGNAGNISHRLEKILIFYNLGLNIFIFDYRGYGKSEGAPSESGLYLDGKGAYNYLTRERRISKDDIIIYGESIGGAVAIDLALKVKMRALITEEAFTSAKDMSEIAFPFVPYFVFSSRFDSVFKIKDIAVAKLIIHSVDDEIVPFRLGEKLFDTARRPKKFLKIRGSHNTAFLESREEYVSGIKAFINNLATEACEVFYKTLNADCQKTVAHL